MSVEALRSPRGASQSGPFIVANDQMVALMATAARVAASEGKVLITGESGVGKDVVARHIHANSRRNGRPFVENTNGRANSPHGPPALRTSAPGRSGTKPRL